MIEERGQQLNVSEATHKVIFNGLKNGTADSLRYAIRSHMQPHVEIIKNERKSLDNDVSDSQ